MNQKYIDFHQFDNKIEKPISNEDYCIGEFVKQDKLWMPFLSFPITKSCNFHCQYCGVGGENTASMLQYTEVAEIQRIVNIAIQNNIIKFRITGGEPFTHPDIVQILRFFKENGRFTLINTNGSLIKKNTDIINELTKNFRFVVSLDTLKPERLRIISKYNNYQDIIDGIHLLKSKDLLMRINTVVSTLNYNEVYDIIDFCKDLGCDLKLLDIVSVPVPFGKRESIYQDISILENDFIHKCDEIYSHEYSRGFGTPCKRYKFGNVYVTVRNSTKGSHYDIKGNSPVCFGCLEFPCHEGLYDIFALSDGRICSCRWTEKQKFSDTAKQIEFLINAFKKSVFIKRNNNKNMRIRNEFIK